MESALGEDNSWQTIPLPDDRLSFSIDTTHARRPLTLLCSVFHDTVMFLQRWRHLCVLVCVCAMANALTVRRKDDDSSRNGRDTKAWQSNRERQMCRTFEINTRLTSLCTLSSYSLRLSSIETSYFVPHIPHLTGPQFSLCASNNNNNKKKTAEKQ